MASSEDKLCQVVFLTEGGTSDLIHKNADTRRGDLHKPLTLFRNSCISNIPQAKHTLKSNVFLLKV